MHLRDSCGGGFSFGEFSAGEEDEAEVLAIGFIDITVDG
jgi:hypothetical protein